MHSKAIMLMMFAAAQYSPNVIVADEIRTVALTGITIAGTDATLNFGGSGLKVPVLNDRGQVAFRALLSGIGINNTNDDVMFIEGSEGGLGLVAREGAPVPGMNAGTNFGAFATAGWLNMVLTNQGEVVFASSLQGSSINSANDTALFRGNSTSGSTLIAREGGAIDGLPSGIVLGSLYEFATHQVFAANSSGDVVLETLLTGPGVDSSNESAIVSALIGAGPKLVARERDAVPGVGGDYTFLSLNDSTFDGPGINDNGNIAMYGLHFRQGMSIAYGAIFTDLSGTLAPGARTGDAVPGVGGSVQFYEGRSQPGLNSRGEVVFISGLTGSGVDSTNDRGLFREGGGSGLALIAREGDVVPGVVGEVRFGDLGFDTPLINTNGKTVFSSSLSGPNVDGTNDEAIFIADRNDVGIIARTGDAAPDTNGVFKFTDIYGKAINRGGQVAFLASIAPGTGEGIFATDKHGNLRLIIREGDMLNVSDDPLAPDFRQIRLVNFASTTNGRSIGFNNRGQLAFYAQFDNGGGIFVSDLVAVPEPNTLVIACLAAVFMARRG
jgi:hypothetical protein